MPSACSLGSTASILVVSRCRGIGPPSGIPSSGLCFCWLPIFVVIQLGAEPERPADDPHRRPTQEGSASSGPSSTCSMLSKRPFCTSKSDLVATHGSHSPRGSAKSKKQTNAKRVNLGVPTSLRRRAWVAQLWATSVGAVRLRALLFLFCNSVSVSVRAAASRLLWWGKVVRCLVGVNLSPL